MKNPFLFEKSLDQKVPEVVRRYPITCMKVRFFRYSDGKQVIIFCASKLGCETLSFSLSKLFPSRMNESIQIDDPKLRILLPLGVGYHHAGSIIFVSL